MAPVPYRLTYSARVSEALKALLERAYALGVGPGVAAAAQDLERRLLIYPQFGEPFRDVPVPGASATEWFGSVGPLGARYVLLEESRQVWVVSLIALMRTPHRPPPPGPA